MKNMKRIISSVMVAVMIFSMGCIGLTANAEGILDEVVLKLMDTPVVEISATEVTRVAAAANSTALGTTIVKATPSGVPYLSGDNLEMVYGGELPAATRIDVVLRSPGIKIRSLTCTNETVIISEPEQETDTKYHWTVQGGQAEPGSVLEFDLSYTWTDGKAYTAKCYSYVDNISVGGSYVKTTQSVNTWRTVRTYYATVAVSSRILGKSVYYEKADINGTYGEYNPSTDVFTVNTNEGYTTSIYNVQEDKTNAGLWDEITGIFKGWTQDVDFNLFATNTSVANVYIDKSTVSSLSDLNLRMSLISGGTSTDNTNSQIRYQNSYTYGSLMNSEPAAYENSLSAANKLGYTAEIGENYNRRSAIKTIGFNGSVANIEDGSSFTIVNHFDCANDSSWNYDLYNNTYIPMPMTFHIVDKSELRKEIQKVLNSDPTSPYVANTNKGKNPQDWYYKSGWANFSTALSNAYATLEKPNATQEEIDSSTSALETMYSNLVLKTADYSAVNAWMEQADAILEASDCYPLASIDLIQDAMACVTNGYNVLYQGTVDIMAKNLRTAIENVAPFTAEYDKVTAALEEVKKLTPKYYSNYKIVDDAVAAVVYDMPMTKQDIVDGFATAIMEAIAALVEYDADYTEINSLIQEANSLVKTNYINFSSLRTPLATAQAEAKKTYKISSQSVLDAAAANLKKAMDGLVPKSADRSKLAAAIALKAAHSDTENYDITLYSAWYTLLNEGKRMYDDTSLSILNQKEIDDKADAITNAHTAMEESYGLSYDASALDSAIQEAYEIYENISNYVEDDKLAEFKDAYSEANTIFADLKSYTKEIADASAQRLTLAMAALTLKDADFTAFNSAVEAFNKKKIETVSVLEYVSGVTKQIDKSKYDETAIADIQKIVDSITPDMKIDKQSDINSAKADILSFTSALTEKIYTEYLDAAKLDYNNEVSTDYDVDLWTAYENAYNASLLVDTTSQTDVDAAVKALAEARSALKPTLVFEPVEGKENVTIDEENKMIYGLEEGISSLEDFINCEGGELDYHETPNGFGTGTTVDVVVGGEVVATYTIVIFGDVNGDGVIDNFDLADLFCVGNAESEYEEGSAYYLAGDVNGDGAVDLFDAAVVAQVGNGEITLSQAKPES